MIMEKQNVVRYIVEVPNNGAFESTWAERDAIFKEFIREGMESEIKKMERKGFSYRHIETNSYTRVYSVEYKTRVTY